MASNVSKHMFFWKSNYVGSCSTETEMFVVRAFDQLVSCFFALGQHPGREESRMRAQFSYQLTWADCEDKPLFCKCDVVIRDKTGIIWSDSKATPKRRHGPPSKSSVHLKSVRGKIRVEFNLKFNLECDLQDDVKDPMSAAELALPLFKDNILSDVVVVCEEKTFDCHKFMLAARSEVFKIMLTSSFKEANTDRIELKECDPKVAKVFIEFIYSDEVAEDAVSWELFDLAKMYQLPRLQGLCLRGLRKKLDVDNCSEMIEATEKYDLNDLFNHAMDFFKKNEAAVVKTEGSKIEKQSQ